MGSIRGERRKRRQVRVGVADRALTANAGLAAVGELCDRLGVIGALDAAVGAIKQRDRGFGAGELLAGIAAAQLAGEDFLTGLDRQRADAAGQQITPVPGLASTTAAGLARRITPAQWQAVESGLAVVTGRMLGMLPAERVTALAGGPVTVDLDTTDVEVTGRKKRGVAYNHQGQRVGRPQMAAWAETEIVLAFNLAWMWGALLAATMAALAAPAHRHHRRRRHRGRARRTRRQGHDRHPAMAADRRPEPADPPRPPPDRAAAARPRAAPRGAGRALGTARPRLTCAS